MNEFNEENKTLSPQEGAEEESVVKTEEVIVPEPEFRMPDEAAAEQIPTPEEMQTASEPSENTVTEPASEPAPEQVFMPNPEPPYRWTFAGQIEAENREAKKEGRKGALVYTVIVTGLFLVCFAILAGILVYGSVHGFSPVVKTVYQDRVVYVHDEATSDGMLSTQEIAAKVVPSTVGVKVRTSSGIGTGTGIILDKVGHIVTNYHVIEGQLHITVITADSKEFSATLVGGHEPSDVAVIKIEPGDYDLQPAEFGDSDSLLVGDPIIAIGNAGGLDLFDSMALFGTVTKGVISGVKRDIKFYDENDLVNRRMTLIQIDANINPGNSGGPLVDAYGMVVGINFMKYVSEKIEGIGFAIPANGVMEIIREVIATGSYSGNAVAEKGVSLGIQGRDVTKGQYISEFNSQTVATGVVVLSVTDENSSAWGALYAGDIIVGIEGKALTHVEEIHTILSKLRVGDMLTVTVVRGYVEMDVVVTLK